MLHLSANKHSKYTAGGRFGSLVLNDLQDRLYRTSVRDKGAVILCENVIKELRQMGSANGIGFGDMGPRVDLFLRTRARYGKPGMCFGYRYGNCVDRSRGYLSFRGGAKIYC